MENTIKSFIDQEYRKLAVFHSGTFDIKKLEKYSETGEEADTKVGRVIDDYIQGLDMDKIQDACYIAGKIDTYRELLSYLQQDKRPLTDVSNMSYTEYSESILGKVDY